MIAELKDEEILDFLMTSEFEGDYSPDELKYLLVKWRYFYRLLHGQLERVRDDREGDARQLLSEIESLKVQLTQSLKKTANLEDDVNLMKMRKLTLKERLTGKIIQKDDENF
jgi:hypothetical protein